MGLCYTVSHEIGKRGNDFLSHAFMDLLSLGLCNTSTEKVIETHKPNSLTAFKHEGQPRPLRKIQVYIKIKEH